MRSTNTNRWIGRQCYRVVTQRAKARGPYSGNHSSSTDCRHLSFPSKMLNWKRRFCSPQYMVWYTKKRRGEVSEWFKELVLKTSEPMRPAGSNPALSALRFASCRNSPPETNGAADSAGIALVRRSKQFSE